MKKVILKKSYSVKNRHPWIFSGSIDSLPDCEKGEILPVYSQEGDLLAHAYFNPDCSLTGRVVSFGDKEPLLAIKESFLQALNLRKIFFNDKRTDSYRLINGEGDSIPGFILDKYKNGLVLQIGTYGIERLKPYLLELIEEHLPCETIYEKSNSNSREIEGLEAKEGFIKGDQKEVEIVENGIKFIVDFTGQKTGFFLDQREMRSLIGNFSKNRRVLNCFCYSGAFSIYAAQNGAAKVDSLDISQKAVELAKRNFSINEVTTPHNFFCEDAFNFLNKPLDYDLIILDPPAFVKQRKDLDNGLRGYRELNRLALENMPKNSLLLTSSCSSFVDQTLFQKTIFQAALEAKKEVSILSYHRQAFDHPINIFHPEGSYLKSLLCFLK